MTFHEATIKPYLFFAGRCEEALAFYEQKLDATVQMKMRFSESPVPLPEGMIQAGFEEKIMHAAFTIGQMSLMASDGCNDSTRFEGFRLALTVPTKEDCDMAFNALAEAGRIDVPLDQTFWSPRYGQVTDPFGVGWMIMVAGETT